eukprot:Protomagalhaensia_sp_Gyna_25__4906@NODE_520_length_3222_cov_224_050895_g409_i0_p2_GENE_NODE_520_length_3222_cov_224_050895_g409_i0NODE_520_length_3222_cov_224_050895_g409_i0_p2_ORF_typecomplete_len388_score74_46_NODE_520_length_3222_cov_224_050895_g409_i01371300
MDADLLKQTILTTVVEHVKCQFEILKTKTNGIPGFHEEILPKFICYINQVEQTASRLQRQYDLDLLDGYLIQLKDSIITEINSCDHHSIEPSEITEFQRDQESIQDQHLSTFLAAIKDRSKSVQENLHPHAHYLEVLERHLPLVRLEQALKQNLNDENGIRNRAQRQNVEKLLQEVAAIVTASACDVRAANSRVCIEGVNLPSTGSKSPMSKRVHESTPSGKTKDSSEPVVPPLWITANLPAASTARPETTQRPNPKEGLKKPKTLQRVTLDHRPIPPNAFDSDDEVSHRSRLESRVNAPAPRGRQLFQQRQDLSSQLTFRPQQQQQMVSPRFGAQGGGLNVPPDPPVGQQPPPPVGRRAISNTKGKRLSLGSRMLNRRSASCYVWD